MISLDELFSEFPGFKRIVKQDFMHSFNFVLSIHNYIFLLFHTLFYYLAKVFVLQLIFLKNVGLIYLTCLKLYTCTFPSTKRTAKPKIICCICLITQGFKIISVIQSQILKSTQVPNLRQSFKCFFFCCCCFSIIIVFIKFLSI